METKANTALIGAFTLVVLALAFVFVYWMARGTDKGSSVPLTVIFEDPITGLSVGSQVVFNGIKIGEVKTLDLNPDRPKVVIAGLSVKPVRSIKADTQVTLGFQGLTGVGYVEMAGGSPSLPPIWEAQDEPTIIATRSSMQDLMAGARTILSRADEVLQTLERTVKENSDDISLAVIDLRKFTSALADNSEDLGQFIGNVSGAAKSISEATAKLDGIIASSEKLLDAVDPEDVSATLKNIRTTSDSLAAQADRIGSIVDRAETITSDAEAFSKHLPSLGEKTETLVAAIDPQKVASALDNIQKFSKTLGDNSENVDQIVADARNLSARFDKLGSQAESLLAKLDGMAGSGPGGLMSDATETLASIKAAADNLNKQIAVVGGNVGDFSDRGLRDLQSLIADGKRTIGRFDKVISDLEKNPAGFLLGGQNVPEYGGRRR